MASVSIDFETRSTVDLRRSGVYPYALDQTTDVWCMAYAIDQGPVGLWVPGDPVPDLPWDAEFRAHNAQFERVIWKLLLAPRHGFPKLPDDAWHCTAAEAAAMNLPRSLGEAARVLQCEAQKDGDGRRLMLQMAKPRRVEDDGTIIWWDDADRKSKLFAYCIQDVETERAIAQRVRRLVPAERQVYLLDQRANDRGVKLDVPLILAAREEVEIATTIANEELYRITRGHVSGVTSVSPMTEWVQAQGVEIDNLRKDTVRDLLGDILPDNVRRVLEIRADYGRTSTAKLNSMLECLCPDDRARGLLLYHGAGTGRWSGKLIQPQNFPRGDVKNPERFIHAIMTSGDLEDYAPLAVVSSLLRAMLVAAPDRRFLAGDFSQIEARVLGWIAGEPYGDREYERMAARIYGKTVDEITNPSEERHVGKGTVLGAGYGMGADTFETQTLQQTGIQLDRGARDEEGRLLAGEVDMAQLAISTYRQTKPGIPLFWRHIEAAAISAVSTPGKVTHVGVGNAIKFIFKAPYLWCILPSGRPICYPGARVTERETPWGEMKPSLEHLTMLQPMNKWGRRNAYGGLLTENVVQAMARDLMAAAMLRLEDAGYPVILTVHDEVVCEVPNDHGSVEEFTQIMTTLPAWATGCPVAAEAWEGPRYRK